MKKEELRKLRKLPATREMMEKGKRMTDEEYIYWDGTKMVHTRAEYVFLARAQNLNGFVKLALFRPEWISQGIQTPIYEVFLNREGEEWITRELDKKGNEVGWSEAMIDNLKKINVYSKSRKIYLTDDTKRTIKLFQVEDPEYYKGIWRLVKWQRNIREKKLKEYEKRQQAPWDTDMHLVPQIMPSFKEWMRRTVCPETYIIYHYDKKGATQGFCSRCRKDVQIRKPRHGEKTVCPACMAKAIFKADSKIQTLEISCYEGEVIQKIKGGIVVRTFYQIQTYRGRDARDPKIYTGEKRRILFFDNGKCRRYRWGIYKNKYDRWIPDDDYFERRESVHFYKKNIGHLKDIQILKRSALFLWKKLPESVGRYLIIERKNPAVEMLAKIGMFKMARDMMRNAYECGLFCEDATELHKLLKIDKARLQRLKKMDGGINALRWMQLEKACNTIWPDQMIKDMDKEYIEPEKMYFLKSPIKWKHCYNYLKKQAELTGETLRQTIITWRDYICMAEQMKMDTTLEQVEYPKDVKEAHDRLVYMSKAKGLEKQAAQLKKKFGKVEEHLGRLKKFEYTDGTYCVSAPETILDIVTEGVVLGHCVHTCDYYFSRIQTDESYLFFLRRANTPEIPWYTMEVEPSGNIRQKRTTGDKQNADFTAALPFLKKWQQHFKKQLTDEERELGKKSNILRKKNYSELRKNGNRVWHGPLAGQLLADVLEKDFMEVV